VLAAIAIKANRSELNGGWGDTVLTLIGLPLRFVYTLVTMEDMPDGLTTNCLGAKPWARGLLQELVNVREHISLCQRREIALVHGSNKSPGP
jgi:hypothetical protein